MTPDIGGHFHGTLTCRAPLPQPTRGLIQLLRAWLGQSPLNHEEGALQPVDSIDLVIVGLGLVLVLLALLRR